MSKTFEKFTVSQSGALIRDGKILVLENVKKINKWEFPGGRIDARENAEIAFQREIREELGFDDFEILGLVDCDIWYSGKGVPRVAIIRLIRNHNEDIQLSGEHKSFKWILEEEIGSISFVWPNADRMAKKSFEFHKHIMANE